MIGTTWYVLILIGMMFLFVVMGTILCKVSDMLKVIRADNEVRELQLLALRRVIYHLQRVEYLERGGELHDEAILDPYPE